ncbi:MAG: sigma-54 dependent transcriptional regulator [Myxococcales bacterium]|nr:sigma-54 dependent transcriptional regulator [Myxococcales bacterium]
MVAKPRILVVDDEPVVRESIHDWFSHDDYPIEMAASGAEAMQKIQESSWDILLTDVKMPGMDGLELQQKVNKIAPDVTVIIMTAYASVDSAMQAIKEGAYDYVTKPLDPEDLEQIIKRACEHRQLVRENLNLKQRIEAVSGAPEEIIGDSPEIRKVRERIATVAPGDAPVLIVGEVGTGRQLVARSIHHAGPRQGMPFVTARCGGASAESIRRDLFGYEKGAFPGADYPKKGKLELAAGGTVFLEEIGELGAEAQNALERALGDKTIFREAGSDPIRVDFRCIATSQCDLAEAVARGEFSAQLQAQLCAESIALPPLRERGADIEQLARHFLARSAQETGARARRISVEATQLLTSYAWPGNVRELRNIIERAAVLQSGDEILPRDLPLATAPETAPTGVLSLAEAEKRHIQKVLAEVSGDRSRAAKALQIDEASLDAMLQKHGLEAPRP